MVRLNPNKGKQEVKYCKDNALIRLFWLQKAPKQAKTRQFNNKPANMVSSVCGLVGSSIRWE
jgi:hypothetical protein